METIQLSHPRLCVDELCRLIGALVNGGPGVSGPMGTKCPSAASPGDPLGTFPSLGKYLAPQGETLCGGETPCLNGDEAGGPVAAPAEKSGETLSIKL